MYMYKIKYWIMVRAFWPISTKFPLKFCLLTLFLHNPSCAIHFLPLLFFSLPFPCALKEAKHDCFSTLLYQPC